MKYFVIAAMLIISPAPAFADTWQAFLDDIASELATQGIDPALFRRAMADVAAPQPEPQEKAKNQPEFVFSFDRYVNRLVTDQRVQNGVEKYQQHQVELTQVSEKYGVPVPVILALWGIESSYGADPGRFNIIPSLATLAYQSHRQAFFRRELLVALNILDEGHITLDDMVGSWAGAMGQCQFIPSSFEHYAVDENGDGRKDIWQTPIDVFGSTANYLNKRGWQTGMSWGEAVTLTKILPRLNLSKHGLSDAKPLKTWFEMGIEIKTGKNPKQHNVSRQARLFMPNGPSARVYLVYKNFDVILDWNRASHFAFSVLSLADRIAMKGTIDD